MKKAPGITGGEGLGDDGVGKNREVETRAAPAILARSQTL
jgi:hypothetical protein